MTNTVDTPSLRAEGEAIQSNNNMICYHTTIKSFRFYLWIASLRSQ
jgi:hypothetical protein